MSTEENPDTDIIPINTMDELIDVVKKEGEHGAKQAMEILFKIAKKEMSNSPPPFEVKLDTTHVKLPQAEHPETKKVTYHMPLGNSMNILGNIAYDKFLSNVAGTEKQSIVHIEPVFWFQIAIEYIMRSMETKEGTRVASFPLAWKPAEGCDVTAFYKIIIGLMEINNWWVKMC